MLQGDGRHSGQAPRKVVVAKVAAQAMSAWTVGAITLLQKQQPSSLHFWAMTLTSD